MFSENSRVKIPAIIQLTRLGYDYLSLRDPSVHSQIDLGTNIFRDIFTNSLAKINSTNTPPHDINLNLVASSHTTTGLFSLTPEERL